GLARSVDARYLGSVNAQGIVDGGVVITAGIDEAVRVIAGIKVIPDDLACRVDAGCNRAVGGQEVVEGGVIAAAIQEAVRGIATIEIIPDDLARVVDAKGRAAVGARERGRGGVGRA